MSRGHLSWPAPSGASARSVDLADWLNPPGEPTECLTEGPGGPWLEVSCWRDGARELLRYGWRQGAWWAVDRTVFHLDDERLVEAERYHSREGENLHLEPLPLPRILALRTWVPLLHGRLMLAHAGAFLHAGRSLRGGLLLVEAGGQQRAQWFVEGVGEVWLGPPKGAPIRAVRGAVRGDQRWLEGVPATLLGAARHPLPERDDRRPERTLF